MPSPSPVKPVLIVTGPPGVGKTAATGILAARSGRAVHLEADVFFRFVRAGYVEPWKPESHGQNETVMRIVAGAAAGYAAAGYFTIVDGIVIPARFLATLRDALRSAGHPVAYAVLRAPFPVCRERVQDREGAPPIDSDALERIWESFENLGGFEKNALDVGDRTPEEVANLLAQRLTAGILAI